MFKAAIRFFALILIGSLLAALIGGAFGAFISVVSPEFVKGLFSLEPEDGSVARFAFSVGMIWGLFLGLGASCVAAFLAALVQIIRLRIEHRNAPTN